MPNLSRNFVAGKMNKVVDERLVPNGEYIDAMNVRMGSTEVSEIGVLENTKGNVPVSELRYIDGTPLSTDARCIGALEDGIHETIYWMVHDPNFPIGATGKLDMIVSFNTLTNILVYHVISIDDGSGTNTTLNFNPDYLITGINKIQDLIFFTDDYNQPRFINVKKNYGNPVGNIDQFTAESLLVIKKPPVEAPGVQPVTASGQENFMDTRFICFAYRYQYENGEFSATSQWSAPSFVPNPFEFSINSFLNEGMVNLTNTAIVTYNSGGPLVKAVELLFKEADNNVIKIIEKLDKSILGLADNTDYTYTFNNSKIFTILPVSELLRLYDNVPRYAKAQTIMGNRLMYGNYVDGYDLIDRFGEPVRLDYYTDLVSELIGSTDITTNTATGSYTFNGPQTIPDSVAVIDLTNAELVEGAALSIEIRLSHADFSGDPPFPTEITQNVSVNFSFFLPTSYNSVYELATSVEFQNAIGTVANIKPVYDPTPGAETSCDGTTFTDQINCALPNNLDSLSKYQSGISGALQPVQIVTSPSSNIIELQMPVMRYVNNLSAPTQSVYEYYEIVSIEGNYQKIASPRSLHSNRGYEIGIVYMDEFGRSTTALVSKNNTEHVPCGYSSRKNSIRVTIPPSQIAPEWATRYKFVIKPDQEKYETIYSSIFFNDPLSNNAYFLLEGENAQKVQTGDRLVVKADTSGPTQNCVYATVLEKEAKASDFIDIPSELDPTVNVPVPSGVYMKINPNDFEAAQNELSVIAPGAIFVVQNNANQYPLLSYPMNVFNTSTSLYVDYTVPAGSRIKMKLRFQRLGVGDGDNECERRIYEIEKTFVSSADYNNMKDWWDGDNVEGVLNDGTQEVGGAQCPVNNVYIDTLAATPVDIPTALCTNYYRFYRDPVSNQLSLLITGTLRCPGILAGPARRSAVIANFEVFRAENTLIFETEPIDALPDVWYENDLSFPIDRTTGDHDGNIQNQDIALGIPAIIDTGFFNCFAFGNGAESYKIRDSIVGKSFNLGNRVTTTSSQEYKEADRFSSISYSGIYNEETNVNKLNEFNLGLLNYKLLESSFGPIFKMDGRETDVLVLQEDKISYVLAGKNLLSDAAAGGAITSVPEVLGTQIARTEKYGISFNPESYVHWGYDRYFTDVKRGAVLQLRGDSYNNDQLRVVSESGMRTWFRDTFNASFNTQKLGGFDPYMNEYVLSINDIGLPAPQECIECGVSQTISLLNPEGEAYQYCVNVGSTVGPVDISYTIVSSGVPDDFIISGSYDAITVSSGPTNTSGVITVNKNLITDDVVVIDIVTTGVVSLEITVNCPTSQILNVVQVVLTNDADSGETIHAEYKYAYGAFTSPLQSNSVTFLTGSTNPIVSWYNITSGPMGLGAFPPGGSTVDIRSNKILTDTFNFSPLNNKFKYLESNTLYPNTPTGINNLIAAASDATPILGAGNLYYAQFPTVGASSYLYLIWDLRSSTALNLCYSPNSAFDACCNCAECEGCITYRVSLGLQEEVTIGYTECFTGEPTSFVLLPESEAIVCTTGAAPVVLVGTSVPSIEAIECGCPS